MKLASLNNGTRDGHLIVVSKDLSSYADASAVAATLQDALDNWDNVVADLEKLIPDTPLDISACHSPLPRAYQWADGSAYINHVELVRKARGAEVPESFYEDPLMYQGGSDNFLAPTEDIPVGDPAWGADMEGEIAVVTGDVPMGADLTTSANAIRLVMLVNDVSLRGLIADELAKGFGFFQSKPPTAFSPIAITLDELGQYWKGGTIALPLNVDYNGKPFGRARADVDLTFTLPRLIQHAAKTRPLKAGTIIGSGTVSNKHQGGPGIPVADGGVGFSCIAEIRMIETINNGKATTPFMQAGDRVRIEMLDCDGQSIFGAIDQKVVAV